MLGLRLSSTAVVALIALSGCIETPVPCTVSANADGSTTISCPDGSRETVFDGAAGADGEDGTDGAAAFVSIEDLDVGDENCEHGGVAITYGLQGDDSEDLETVYLCNSPEGEDGRGTILDVDVLEEGDEHCPNGGLALTYGYDDDDPDDLEVVFVCNGEDGVEGPPGSVFFEVVEADEGVCEHGGVILRHGDEASPTETPVCNGPPGDDGAAGASAIYEFEPLDEDDDRCPAGGTEVFFGQEGDGREEMESFVVCHGEDGADGRSAVLTVTAASDEDCDHGGYVLTYGYEGEDLTTELVCNGAPGDAGEAGVSAAFDIDRFGGDDPRCGEGISGVEVFYGLSGEDLESFLICDGADGRDGRSAVFNVNPASELDCPAGGIVLRYGYEGEELEDELICNGVGGDAGEAGASAVFEVDDIPVGDPRCEAGGIELSFGLDTDETLTTVDLCHGEDGAPGASAVFEVDRFEGEDPRCGDGVSGVEISYGLEGDETLQTFLLCDGADGLEGRGAVLDARPATPEECPAGGLYIEYGYEGEPLDDELICNGEDGRAAFFDIVDIDLGDRECPYGGLRFIYGYADDDPDDLETVEFCDDCDPTVSGATMSASGAPVPFAVKPEGEGAFLAPIRYVNLAGDWSQFGFDYSFLQALPWRWEIYVSAMGGDGGSDRPAATNPFFLGPWFDAEEEEILRLTCDLPIHGCASVELGDRTFQWTMSYVELSPELRLWISTIDADSDAPSLALFYGAGDEGLGWYFMGQVLGEAEDQFLGESLPTPTEPADVSTAIGGGLLSFEPTFCLD